MKGGSRPITSFSPTGKYRTQTPNNNAFVMELVDMAHLECAAIVRVGSSPTKGTKLDDKPEILVRQ